MDGEARKMVAGVELPGGDRSSGARASARQRGGRRRAVGGSRTHERGAATPFDQGLPRNRALLAELARELKRACGSGGAAGEERVEIQGDHRERLRELLAAKGWTVKG